MLRKVIVVILLAAVALNICACGSVFDKEYLVISDYVPAAPQEIPDGEKVVVKNYTGLKQAILAFVTEGREEGEITFDSEYIGNAVEDVASACWQIRTQNALCAYCVGNISYEVSHIVTHDEAVVHISYADFGGSVDDIRKLSFSSNIEDLMLEAMDSGEKKLVMYILNGVHTAEGMESLAAQVYRDNPACVPKEPKVKVNVYSGTGNQRLYEIDFDYGMPAEELMLRKERLTELDVFSEEERDDPDEGRRALSACEYLAGNCNLSSDSGDNNAYTALIDGRGDSEGLALAFVALCRELGLSCKIVYGQKDWESHCWNIVTVDGCNYHVDISECIRNAVGYGFMLSDADMWARYRWDISSYPACNGELSYAQVAGIEELLTEPAVYENNEQLADSTPTAIPSAQPDTELQNTPEPSVTPEADPTPEETSELPAESAEPISGVDKNQ